MRFKESATAIVEVLVGTHIPRPYMRVEIRQFRIPWCRAAAVGVCWLLLLIAAGDCCCWLLLPGAKIIPRCKTTVACKQMYTM